MQLCNKILFEFKLFNLIDFEIETMKFRGHIWESDLIENSLIKNYVKIINCISKVLYKYITNKNIISQRTFEIDEIDHDEIERNEKWGENEIYDIDYPNTQTDINNIYLNNGRTHIIRVNAVSDDIIKVIAFECVLYRIKCTSLTMLIQIRCVNW